MMKKIFMNKKVMIPLGILMVVIIAGSFLVRGALTAVDKGFACSGMSVLPEAGDSSSDGVFGGESVVNSDDNYDVAGEEAAVEYQTESESLESPAEGQELTSDNQKMITNWDLTVETKNYDQTMQQLYDSIKKMGGYIESESQTKNYDNTRSNYLKIRIPENQAEDWVTNSADFGTIISKAKTQQNATLQYIDIESRISSLYAEKEALEAILKSAKSVKDIIEVQSELQNVNYQIEDYQTQFRYLNNDIRYDTIQLNIYEVFVETNQDLSFYGEVKARFINSLHGLGYFFRNIAIGLLGYSLYIVFAAVVVFVVVCLFKKYKLRNAKVYKNGSKQKDNNDSIG